MNISALLVFVSAVVSVYGYHALPCSDCNHPCNKTHFTNVKEQLRKDMKFSDCKENDHISNKANPIWKCVPCMAFDKIQFSVHNATCKKCPDPDFEAVPILQNINMLFQKSCLGTNHAALYVKPVTLSLGCTCVESLIT